MYTELKQRLSSRINETIQTINTLRKSIYTTGTIRLFVFIGTIALAYCLRHQSPFIIAAVVSGGTVLFLFLLVKYNRLQKQKDFYQTSLRLDEQELKALDYDYSAYDGVPEQADASHSFSLDLDVFGNRSLFQMMNRTSTVYGKSQLIDFLANPLKEAGDIRYRQSIVKELGSDPDFLHTFQVTGHIHPGKESDYQEMVDFVRSGRTVRHLRFWKILGILLPICWMAIIALLVLDKISFSLFTVTYTVALLISLSQTKLINKLQQTVGKKVDILRIYSNLMRIVEDKSFESEGLATMQNAFLDKGKASQSIRKLANLVNELDQRANLLVQLIMNPLLLWDIRKAIAVEEFKEELGEYLIDWIRLIGTFDAYVSLGNFRYTHPDYTFPSFSDSYFKMEGKALGHPLMNREKCVRNDISIGKAPYFLVVTGANMAGKSTYLRTIGVNYLLACIGAPVCAEKLELYPASLITSLRTSDSLNDNESYFFAELKRLKMIIDRLQQGEECFIILDEILKGTNSVDKQKGSLALVQQLISLRSTGIIATHDLLLGSLEERFPEAVKNYRFEADIQNEELHFSYQIRPGIAQNMNASFLMKKMGITL